MSDDQPLLTERRGEKDGILWMTLNRPERLNALTFPMLHEMREVFFAARFDRSLRCIVITGAGRGFCSGMDMGGAANPDPDPPPPGLQPGDLDLEGHRFVMRRESETFTALRRLETPIIAAVNGPCVGAGFDLASLCDMAVVSKAAKFQVAYVKRGLHADLGGFWSLPRVLGWRKAMELMMTGRFMSPEEAHAAGFSNALVEPEDLEAETMRLALEIEAGPPIAQRIGKLLATRSQFMDFDSALQWSETAIPLVDLSADHKEGVAAFREKRPADFRGF